VAKGAQGYIKQARTSRGAQVYCSRHKGMVAHKFKGVANIKESSRLSLRGASTLYQVPLFHFSL
jgi:hypothetical protein